LSSVSAYGTKLAILAMEDFWFIETAGKVKISQKSFIPPVVLQF